MPVTFEPGQAKALPVQMIPLPVGEAEIVDFAIEPSVATHLQEIVASITWKNIGIEPGTRPLAGFFLGNADTEVLHKFVYSEMEYTAGSFAYPFAPDLGEVISTPMYSRANYTYWGTRTFDALVFIGQGSLAGYLNLSDGAGGHYRCIGWIPWELQILGGKWFKNAITVQ